MSKAYNFDWRIEVSPRLVKGDLFDRWDDDNGTFEQNCLFRVDNFGFFIYWQSDGRDGQVIELSQVSDIRPGKCKCLLALPFSRTNDYLLLLSADWSKDRCWSDV